MRIRHNVQEQLDRLKRHRNDPLWGDAPNGWIRLLDSNAVGQVGEELVLAVIGGNRMSNNFLGYDIVFAENCIEVKLATLGLHNGYPILKWNQIRPADAYTHLCFIAVYPRDVRMFMVPRDAIPTSALTHQHGRGDSLGLYNIRTRKVDQLFPWMTKFEVGIEAGNG